MKIKLIKLVIAARVITIIYVIAKACSIMRRNLAFTMLSIFPESIRIDPLVEDEDMRIRFEQNVALLKVILSNSCANRIKIPSSQTR